jgi:hypothetical protein
MKNSKNLFLVLLALGLFAGTSYGGTITVDLDREDVSVINGGADGAGYLIIDLSSLSVPERVRVLSAYLYLDISADRNSDSAYPGELLTLGVSPCTAEGRINESILITEYTLLPSTQNTAVLDLSRLFSGREEETGIPSWVAVYGRDENEEGYLLGLPRGAGFTSRLELRYSQ